MIKWIQTRNVVNAAMVITCGFIISCSHNNNSNVKIGYYKNHVIKSIAVYKNGMKDGESFWFYPNGFLEMKLVYAHDEANGDAYYFYESGALKSRRYWKNDRMVGLSADYWDDTFGMLRSSLIYNNSGVIIHEKEFDRHGHFIAKRIV